jgi:hypothetical protein
MAPADLVEEFAYVITVVFHPQSMLNQLGNSLSGPQLGPVSLGHRSFCKETNKLFLLFRG